MGQWDVSPRIRPYRHHAGMLLDVMDLGVFRFLEISSFVNHTFLRLPGSLL